MVQKNKEAEQVYICGFDVRIMRKKVKNLNLRVKPPHGLIEVSAPLRMPYRQIEDFICAHSAWIKRQIDIIAHSPAAAAENATDEQKRAWKEVVSACVPPLIEAWEPIMGVRAGKIAYRNMKSRWGSCQPSTGRICINTRLALYPPECLEYVVVHELCHLIERGHGPKFHRLMDAFMPDWKERRAKLR